jgi:hypothetical protein
MIVTGGTNASFIFQVFVRGALYGAVYPGFCASAEQLWGRPEQEQRVIYDLDHVQRDRRQGQDLQGLSQYPRSSQRPRDRNNRHHHHLESEKYSDIKISIKKITADPALYTYKVSADVTMHGVTKTVDFKTSALSFTGADGKLSLSISGKVKINMTDWGMTPPSIVVNKVSPDVVIGWSLIAQKK